MAKNQTLELSILIGGHVDNSLTQAVKSANTQLSSMANGASKLAANIAKVTVGIASGITAGLVDATKEAVAFESEMLDVTKYVGGLTDANGKVKTDAYAEMSKDILDLSTQIPYTAKELTRLAAAAGQSGKSMDDLISGGFLKDVAEMGTAMDISADQAGDWAAKWEVAFNMNHDQVMELADQINYLGAHYATTAAEIAQTVNDTGSLGQIAGMDVQSTAALSTALLAMGVDSGKVATSIRRMYTNLSMGSKATDAQSAAFEQLGFTAEQFAKDMQKDATAALKSLFTAIGTQPKDKQVGYLKTLLGQWAIESGAKLTGNLDLFVKTLDDVGDASKYNGSMYKEFMVCVLHNSDSQEMGTCIGTFWNEDNKPVGGKKQRYRYDYNDKKGKAFEQYDGDSGDYEEKIDGNAKETIGKNLDFTVGGDVTFKVGASTVKVCQSGTIEITGTTVKITGATVNISGGSGDCKINGVSLVNHKHEHDGSAKAGPYTVSGNTGVPVK